MFEKIASGVSEFFSDAMPRSFSVGCFLQGLVQGAVLAVVTVAAIAALPAELAIVATVGLAVLGVYGIAQLVKNWSGMSDGAKSKALGNITGSFVGGLAGAKMVAPAEPLPPGIKLLETPDGAKVPVLAAEEGTETGALSEAGEETGTSTSKPTFTEQEIRAQQRQQQMLKDNAGYNVSPTSWDKYPTIGKNGTYLTDQQAITESLGDFPEGQSNMTISKAQARQMENNLGLERGSLDNGFKIRKVDGIQDSGARSPLEGNDLFRGPGKNLPGGGPEMQVDSIPTSDSEGVSTIMNVEVK